MGGRMKRRENRCGRNEEEGSNTTRGDGKQ